MRCSAGRAASAGAGFAGALAFAAFVALLAVAPPARAVTTDAYTAVAPHSPWRRVEPFDEVGRVAFAVPATNGARTLVALSFEAVTEDAPDAALAALLERERALVRAETDDREDVERSSFRPDSMDAGGMRWHGVRVDVKTGPHQGSSWRWFALHPDFPRRKRAFRLAFDDYAPAQEARAANRIADVRAFAAGVRPRGMGWTGPLTEAFGDARAATFAARIDSAMHLCWTNDSDAAPARRALALGVGVALEGDFFELAPSVPRDSLVDAGSAEYGTAFDRNRDGRYDLVIYNRGVQAFQGERLLPVVAAVADDDFDGRLDAAIVENVDRDGDGKADHRLYVHDSNSDGIADRAVVFRDAVDAPDAERVTVRAGVVPVRLAGQSLRSLSFDQVLGAESELLTRLDQARAACVARAGR